MNVLERLTDTRTETERHTETEIERRTYPFILFMINLISGIVVYFCRQALLILRTF